MCRRCVDFHEKLERFSSIFWFESQLSAKKVWLRTIYTECMASAGNSTTWIMLIRGSWFFPSSSCVIFVDSLWLSLSIFLSCSTRPVGPVGSNVWHRQECRRHGLFWFVVLCVFFLLRVVLFSWIVSDGPCLCFVSLSPFGPVGSLGGGLWSSGDIRDASPGFPLHDLHFYGETYTAACFEIIAHSSSLVGRSVSQQAVVQW